MSFLGFLFWMLNARLFSADAIGQATVLISAASLISFVSLLGFNSTFIRFLPQESDRRAHINTGLTLCATAAVLVGLVYVLALPVLAPKLDFIRQNTFYSIAFIGLTACLAINLLTDSVFIAFRETKYNLLVDGFIQGITKIGLPFLLVGVGAFGIFVSSGLAAGLAVLASIYFMRKVLGHRCRPAIRMDVVRRAARFSIATYVASLLNLFPVLVVPLIVLNRDGARAAGYYFVAFQLATLLYSMPFAISESTLAEGSRSDINLSRLAWRSIIFSEVIASSGAVVLAAGSHYILYLFGKGYSGNASVVLAGLALGAPASALFSWAAGLLRVTKQLFAVIVSNLVYSVVVVGIVWFYASRGLGLVAFAWFCGNLLASVVAALALRVGWRKHVVTFSPSHRAERGSSRALLSKVPKGRTHKGLHRTGDDVVPRHVARQGAEDGCVLTSVASQGKGIEALVRLSRLQAR